MVQFEALPGGGSPLKFKPDGVLMQMLKECLLIDEADRR